MKFSQQDPPAGATDNTTNPSVQQNTTDPAKVDDKIGSDQSSHLQPEAPAVQTAPQGSHVQSSPEGNRAKSSPGKHHAGEKTAAPSTRHTRSRHHKRTSKAKQLRQDLNFELNCLYGDFGSTFHVCIFNNYHFCQLTSNNITRVFFPCSFITPHSLYSIVGNLAT